MLQSRDRHTTPDVFLFRSLLGLEKLVTSGFPDELNDTRYLEGSGRFETV